MRWLRKFCASYFRRWLEKRGGFFLEFIFVLAFYKAVPFHISDFVSHDMFSPLIE